MLKIERILVVIDPTVERDFVIDRLRALLKYVKPAVRFFINSSNTLSQHSYAYEGMDGAFFEKQRQLFVEHYRKILDELLEDFANEGVSATAAFSEEHHLAESILNQVKEFNPDLVMKSTHHHGILRRSVISNTDWRLIRKCPKPLLLIKPRDWIAESGSIVASVDPLHVKAQQTRLDPLLVETAKLLSEEFHQKERVFHCYFPFVSTMFPTASETSEQVQEIRRRHEVAVHALVEKLGVAKEDAEIAQGDLVPSLVRFLEKVNANILIIGALSRNVLERAIVGNTAEKILDDCPCDVLILKP